jgi:hypothetical protein
MLNGHNDESGTHALISNIPTNNHKFNILLPSFMVIFFKHAVK